MKRFIKLMTIAIIMLVIAAMYNPSVEAASPKKMYVDIKPDVASAKISWDKKKVSYYEVYRAKVTKIIKKGKYSLKESKYKKVAKVSKKKKSYTDKKVKTGEYYAYVVYGYRKKNGKYKKVYSSFIRADYMRYDYIGFTKPFVNKYMSEEDVENDANYVALNMSYSLGAKPKKFIIYRKAQGESEFKKIATTSAYKHYDSERWTYRDDTVKTNVKYQYKVKFYKKVGKKKYYSKFSDVYTVTPCNKTGAFKATSITPAGKNVKDIVVKLVSDKNNGTIDFFKNYYPEDGTYKYQNDRGDIHYSCADLIQYSYNNTDWINTSGNVFATLEPGKTIYLRYRLSNYEDDTSDIEYGASGGQQSELDLYSVKYHGPNSGESHIRIDLCEGDAYASQYEEY